MPGRTIRVRGAVQGVGFRPFVWRLARELGLCGSIANDGEGVHITAWGTATALDLLAQRLVREAPPLARIDRLTITALPGPPPENFTPENFTIAASTPGPGRPAIAADAATCPACRAEIADPADRRYRHAFANCTDCGPRLSILTAIPYDRAHTSMADFPLCPACAADYADPADRRFHAQPICCPDCGPRLWIEPGEDGADPIAEAVRRLQAGQIVAIKGLGGFHLACDAQDPVAVAALRAGKQRDAKPFALMTRDLAAIARYCRLDAEAEAVLLSPTAPIVLLPRRPDAPPLPDALAPDQDHLGFMLPYTPLHHLLLAEMTGPLVMTSGNRSDAPQIIDNAVARHALAGTADSWLLHDRVIHIRLDDSVIGFAGNAPIIFRRARGFVPEPIRLHDDFRTLPPTLALGGALKATFCLLRDGEALVSHHIGDLDQAETFAEYRAMLERYRQLYDFTPAVIAIDAHGDYRSSHYGRALAAESGARLVEVAHHHAHVAACLAENGIGVAQAEEALGLVLDGLGLGADGSLWGGELLAGGYRAGRRLGHLLPVALPGGNAAMREPWRNLLAHLLAAFGPDWRTHAAPVLAHLPAAPKPALIEAMIASATNSPLCSSAGRWFDAVAAALGCYPLKISYEGQAAMALETLARPFMAEARAYPWMLHNGVLSWQPFWQALLADLALGTSSGRIAARAHATLVEGVLALIDSVGGSKRTVALSGGVMQNRILATTLSARLTTPLLHRRLPPNDGGLSLGQAVIAALAV